MDLEAARALKQRIRRSAGARERRFATGISLTGGGYRVAVLLHDERDRGWLESRVLKSVPDAGEIEIDVIGRPQPAMGPATSRPAPPALSIGASVGHGQGGVGSLAFFATRRSDGARGFVSCNHVIAMVDEGRDGDAVVSPSRLDDGGRVVAALDGRYPRLGGAPAATADCAFASLKDGVACDAATLPGGTLASTPAEVTEALEVTKVGRITDARPGIVKRIEVDDVWIRYGMTRVAFHDVIQIGTAGPWRFCEHGDSGALVYAAATFQPVGLLFATSSAGGPHDAGWTWAHPIRQVTAALDVELVNS